MIKLSVVIITYNEESNIKRCLNSILPVADDIVVVDSGSTDQTVNICQHMGARVVVHPFEGHIQQKNWAVTQALYPHVLSLDADEELSPKLQDEIQRIKKNWQFDGYYMNRRNNYCGTWINFSGWYPDRKLRLWDSRKGKWTGRNPHDRYQMLPEAKASHIKGDLLHYTYKTIEQHLDQIQKFSTISAKEKFEKGKNISVIVMVLRPFAIFLKKYFLKLGILDGYAGFIISVLTAYYTFVKDIKLRELNKKPFMDRH
jgi:glycosyltransferase involved in cell wall biosynthesis